MSQILSVKYSYLDSPQSASNNSLLNEKQYCPEQWPELEKSLFDWIQHTEGSIIISQEVIREKARQFWLLLYTGKEMPIFSNGWLCGFQACWDIRLHIQYGEAGSLQEEATIEMFAIQHALSLYAP